MKLCYCDETGTGEEPYAVLLGVVVDASRMHVTKDNWAGFLAQLSEMVGQEFQELHTRNFYAGSGIWKKLTGQQRSEAIDFFIDWFSERKHHVVFSAVDKQQHKEMQDAGAIPEEIDTVWKAMGFHVALAIQRNFQGEAKDKGNTISVFDEEVKEETRFQKLLLTPPHGVIVTMENRKSKSVFANSLMLHISQIHRMLGYCRSLISWLISSGGILKYLRMPSQKNTKERRTKCAHGLRKLRPDRFHTKTCIQKSNAVKQPSCSGIWRLNASETHNNSFQRTVSKATLLPPTELKRYVASIEGVRW